MRSLLRRLAYLVRWRRMDADLREEMDFHRSMLAHRSPGGGGFGNGTLAREDAHAVWIGSWLESVGQDLRYAARSLRRDAAFTIMALGALGAAIGLNTSLFTTFNGVMWRPWPVPEPSRVVTIVNRAGQATRSVAEYEYFARNARSFSGVVATRCIEGITDGCAVQVEDARVAGAPLQGEFVSRNYFEVLSVGLARGAGFREGADATGSANAVAVLSDATWRVRFGADPGIVGRQVRVDDVPFTIVGVAPAGFTGTQMDRKDLWIPLEAIPLLRPHFLIDDAKRHALLSGRLADGVSRSQAQAELETLSHQYRAAAHEDDVGVRLIDTTFFPSQGKRGSANAVFALLLFAVLLVLGLACANVGNLLLARAAARRREVAVRLAIGASRARVVRQLLTECLLLATMAAGLGLLVAFRLPPLLFAQLGGPLSVRIDPDLHVLGYTLALAVGSCLGFGLAPALHGSRASVSLALKGQTFVSASRLPLRSLLLATQVAIAIILLVNAGLIVRGVQALGAQNPGFDMQDVSVVSFELPASYDTARVRAFAHRILEEGPAAVAGHSAGFADIVPFGAGGRMWATAIDSSGESRDVLALETSAGYFDTLRIPIVLGRNFQSGDAARRSVLVNETMARQFWPDASPLGQVFRSSTEWQVVGVVKDVRHYRGSVGLTFPTMYQPIDGRTIPQVLVRRLDSASAQALTGLATRLEPRARHVISPLSRNLEDRIAQSRVGAWVAAGLGALALVLATLGVFSVFAYTVEQRTAEVGIRMALGARPSQVIRTIAGSSARALAAGTMAGLAAAAMVSRLIRVFLYGLSPFDPVAYACVAAVVILAGVAATVYPARRATQIDPVRALRCE